MRKLFLFLGILCVGFCSIAHAENITRAETRSYSDQDQNIYTSTGVDQTAQDGVIIATGIIRVPGVHVSSAGINSRIRFNDNLTGNTTNQVGVPIQTNTYGWVPLYFETDRGLIFTSTCSACLQPWTPPILNIPLRRVR